MQIICQNQSFWISVTYLFIKNDGALVFYQVFPCYNFRKVCICAPSYPYPQRKYITNIICKNLSKYFEWEKLRVNFYGLLWSLILIDRNRYVYVCVKRVLVLVFLQRPMSVHIAPGLNLEKRIQALKTIMTSVELEANLRGCKRNSMWFWKHIHISSLNDVLTTIFHQNNLRKSDVIIRYSERFYATNL